MPWHVVKRGGAVVSSLDRHGLVRWADDDGGEPLEFGRRADAATFIRDHLGVAVMVPFVGVRLAKVGASVDLRCRACGRFEEGARPSRVLVPCPDCRGRLAVVDPEEP